MQRFLVKAASSLALIGCGYWGKNLARNFNDLGSLHTICEANTGLHAELKETYPDVTLCTNVEEVFSNSSRKTRQKNSVPTEQPEL